MSDAVSVHPGPGGWVAQAQAALDDLSAATTLRDVETRFGTARHLTELVLGFPAAGGHATRRAIRTVGRLLRHRLGPAIAAEALTWSASAVGLVESTTIEILLELACEAPGTYRPWHLDRRWIVSDRLRAISRPSSRTEALVALWNVSRSHLAHPDQDYHRRTIPGQFDDWARDEPIEDIAQWLRGATSAGHPLDPLAMAQLDAEQQRELLRTATSRDLDRLAGDDGLFSLDTSVIGECLVRATRSTLLNRSCSPELRDRVRYPYDLATLELALRAGPGCFERSRMRRMLGELTDDGVAGLLSSVPVPLVENVRELGLLTVDDIVGGRLRDLDLSDRNIARAAFGEDLDGESVRLFAEVLLRHRQAAELIWMVDDAPRGIVSPDQARCLVDEGAPQVARAVMRHLPFDRLRPSDVDCARQCGDAWLASCPGVPATERPPLPMDLALLGQADTYSPGRRIWYPPQVLQLDDARFPEASNWRVTLPLTVADIQRNARLMRNCTARLVDQVLEASVFLVIVHDPEGHRYNVAVVNKGNRFVVGAVNSWANGGVEPQWIRRAFQSRLDQPDRILPWEDPGRFRRGPTTHRDRRRARARAARRLKR